MGIGMSGSGAIVAEAQFALAAGAGLTPNAWDEAHEQIRRLTREINTRGVLFRDRSVVTWLAATGQS